MEDSLVPLEGCITTQFIPTITGGHHVDDEEHSLRSLPPRLGGLELKNPIESAPVEFENSNNITKELQAKITKRPTEINMPTTRQQIKNERRRQNKAKVISSKLQ